MCSRLPWTSNKLLRACNQFVVSGPRNCYYAGRVFVLKNSKNAGAPLKEFKHGPVARPDVDVCVFSKKTDNPNPWCYAAVRPPVCFGRKNLLDTTYYEKQIRFICFSKKTDNPNPWCYAAVRPSGFCFSAKIISENITMRIYEKKKDLCVFLRKLIKYAPPFPPRPTTLVPPQDK